MVVAGRGTRRPKGFLFLFLFPLFLLVLFSITFLWISIPPSVQTGLQMETLKPASQGNQAYLAGRQALVGHGVPYALHPRVADLGSSPAVVNSTPPPVNWDEQLGLTISQNSPSLSYNVTAVEQTDSDGYGPAYLLNGLTDTGGWYQVGLAYNWPLAQGGYDSGFTFLYEAFNLSGVSVYPSDGGGGLLNYSGQINAGDVLLLSLNFTNNQVVMYSYDWNTSSSAFANYTADGGLFFVGLQTENNNNGFFSGLMTEQYHALPFYGAEVPVTYSNSYVGLNAATMWIDEYNFNTNQTLFGETNGELPYANPNQFITFSVDGATEESDSYEFITGSNALASITMSYSIAGGGSGYEAPLLNYVSNGAALNATLTTTPTEYFMDKGSTWSVTDPLNGSSSSQEWITSQSGGTVTSTETISLIYTQEFNLTFAVTPLGSGSISPSVSSWYEAGTMLNLNATPEATFLFSSWLTNSKDIQFANITSATTTATINGPGSVVAEFSTFSLSLSSYSGSVIEGSSISSVAKIVGENGSVTLSVSGLPSGAMGTWTNSTVAENVNGALDNLNISTSFSTPPGTYDLTITGNSGNVNNSVQFTLTIEAADPLTVSFTVSDGSSLTGPTLTYVYNGNTDQVALTSIPQVIYVDNGSTWQITSSANVSGSQRWVTSSPTQGTASGPSTVDVLYYHQFLVAFTLNSADNETTAPEEFPNVNYTSLGHTAGISANGSQVWVDSGTIFSYSTTIAMSGVERLVLSGNNTGEVTGPITASAKYIQEYLVEASFDLYHSPSSTTVSPPPELSFEENGSAMTVSLSENGSNYWIDSGSSWSVSANLSGSTLIRWLGNDISGTVNSTAAIRPEYTPQYYVMMDQNIPSAGSISAKNGWYAANTSISVDAIPNQGWSFEAWTGDAGTFNQSSTTILVNAPLNETALFYPGLVINAASNGEVTYSYGSISGTVRGGSSTTLYLPPDTNVSLTASSNSEFYTPGSWSVGNDSSNAPSSFTLLVTSPTSVGISFNLDMTIIALIAAIVVGLLGSVVFMVFRKRGGKDLSVGASHSWKW